QSKIFKLMFDKVLSASAAGMKKNPDNLIIYKKKDKSSSCPCILNDERKRIILEWVDDNPSIALEQLMKKIKSQTVDRIRKWDEIDMDFRRRK
ncbi:hypothetical protein CLU79DRAFT_692319, partial [Phycomyces nitens]